VTLTLTLKFNGVLHVVKVHARAKCHQANCSSPWVINSALDFGQLWTSIANICWTDQAIDKRKTALSTTIFSTFDEEKFGKLWSTNEKNDLDLRPMTSKFNRIRAVVKIHVHAKFHRANCSGSGVIDRGDRVKRNSDENNTVRRYCAPPRTPLGHIWALIWSGVRGNTARTAL